jgi:hypothetical protein
MFGLTQENLADAAGLTTRTIEKAESGRHRPEEPDAAQQKPTPEQEARQTWSGRSGNSGCAHQPNSDDVRFLAAFGERHAFRIECRIL